MPVRKLKLVLDPVQAAEDAGLRWVSDDRPGIRRLKRGRGFRYVDAEGRAVRDERTLARIRKLVIPPAWTSVWICPTANGHVQATGRDARGRKQYRYHERWREKRDETKYDKMLMFGYTLPLVRARIDTDLKRTGLPREKVLATVVRLLETTLIRVGNEEYARTNKSFGLTTLRNKHVDIDGARLRFEFRGKSGVKHSVSVQDRRLARVVRRCQDLPGHELFQFFDDDGELRPIASQDVNDYLKQITNQDITAKDFRTWNGTVLAAAALREAMQAGGPRARSKRVVTRCIDQVAQRLGNTKTVCRKCYVHPAVIESYLDGTLDEALAVKADPEAAAALDQLSEEEVAVLLFLRSKIGREVVASVSEAAPAA
ncbi:MAG: topoisomerase [Myxococcales bacterium]|nr:topoisomerase [Myxococcales bacterium]